MSVFLLSFDPLSSWYILFLGWEVGEGEQGGGGGVRIPNHDMSTLVTPSWYVLSIIHSSLSLYFHHLWSTPPPNFLHLSFIASVPPPPPNFKSEYSRPWFHLLWDPFPSVLWPAYLTVPKPPYLVPSCFQAREGEGGVLLLMSFLLTPSHSYPFFFTLLPFYFHPILYCTPPPPPPLLPSYYNLFPLSPVLQIKVLPSTCWAAHHPDVPQPAYLAHPKPCTARPPGSKHLVHG